MELEDPILVFLLPEPLKLFFYLKIIDSHPLTLWKFSRSQVLEENPSVPPHFQGHVSFLPQAPPEWARQRWLHSAGFVRPLSSLWCSYSLSNAIRCDFLPNSNFMNILQSYSFVSWLLLAFFKETVLEERSMHKCSSLTVGVSRFCSSAPLSPGAASLSHLERKPENLQAWETWGSNI